MPRSMADPDYERRPLSPERRARLSAFHRKRWGAPAGFCTIYGIHVPFEHRDPVRYWADWIAHKQGADGARAFINELKDAEWRAVARLRELWEQKKALNRNADLIRGLVWEAYRANKNSR